MRAHAVSEFGVGLTWDWRVPGVCRAHVVWVCVQLVHRLHVYEMYQSRVHGTEVCRIYRRCQSRPEIHFLSSQSVKNHILPKLIKRVR